MILKMAEFTSPVESIATQLRLRHEQVAAGVALLDAGNILPFLARYRKEATGGLDEEQIRQVAALLSRLRALDERRRTMLSSIAEQGLLTPELEQQIAAETISDHPEVRRRTREKALRWGLLLVEKEALCAHCTLFPIPIGTASGICPSSASG